jgi:transposase InsO family protein
LLSHGSFCKIWVSKAYPLRQWARIYSKAVRRWLERIGVQTLYIEPGSPWENGYSESFNGNYEMSYSMGRYPILLGRLR